MEKATRRWLIICTISVIMIILLQNVEALPLWKVTYNESLCSCTAGTGSSSFNYADYFNQGLNTTSDILANTMTSTSFVANEDWGSEQVQAFYEPLGWSNYVTKDGNNSAIFFGGDDNLGMTGNYYDYYFEALSYDGVTSRDNLLLKFNTLDATVALPQLIGSGSAFACLDENGTLFRSAVACS